MLEIELIIGVRYFTCRQVKSVFSNQESFHVSSINNWRLADSIEDFMKFVNFHLSAEEEQRIEWNEEFAQFPEQKISQFRIPHEMSGLVDIDQMKFESGTFAGHTFTSEF